jgi:hypothetical protein
MALRQVKENNTVNRAVDQVVLGSTALPDSSLYL